MEPRLSPQPLTTYTQPAITEALNPAGARLAYVRCLRTVPPVSDVDGSSPGWVFRTLDTGHWPMITDAAKTAAVIAELATP